MPRTSSSRPNSSLSPRMRVREIIGEPLRVQGIRGKDLAAHVRRRPGPRGLRADVGHRYPTSSPGDSASGSPSPRRSRPAPTSSCSTSRVGVDVSIRAQILNLFRSLQEDLQLTYVTIAHDLAVVYQACDRTAYVRRQARRARAVRGRVRTPLHPYTRVLLSAIPLPNPRRENSRRCRRGEIPSPANPPAGAASTPAARTRRPLSVDEPEWRRGRARALGGVPPRGPRRRRPAVLDVPGSDDAEPAA